MMADGDRFSALQHPGACCHWAAGPHAKALWLYNSPSGSYTSPIACERLCRADNACLFFSHSARAKMCQFCSACDLSSNTSSGCSGRASSSHCNRASDYTSWKRVAAEPDAVTHDAHHGKRDDADFMKLMADDHLPHLCPRQSDYPRAMRRWPPGLVFVDVGAHDGAETVAFAQLGMDVLTFEPAPLKIRGTRHSIEAQVHKAKRAMTSTGLHSRIPFGNVTLVSAAVSNRSGHASFFVNDASGSQRDTLAHDPLGLGKPVTVPVTTLDHEIYSLAAATGRDPGVAFLKIDAQVNTAEESEERGFRARRLLASAMPTPMPMPMPIA